eukprot:2932693-Pyramimonas_sp.AAC.1
MAAGRVATAAQLRRDVGHSRQPRIHGLGFRSQPGARGGKPHRRPHMLHSPSHGEMFGHGEPPCAHAGCAGAGLPDTPAMDVAAALPAATAHQG